MNMVRLVRCGGSGHTGSGLKLVMSDGEDGGKQILAGEECKEEIWYEIAAVSAARYRRREGYFACTWRQSSGLG